MMQDWLAMPFFLEVTENTLAKLQPKQASELRPGELQPLAKESRLELQSYAYADEGGRFNGHIKFAIANPEDWLANLSTWYVYEGHARVLQDDRVVYPPPTSDEPSTQFTLRIVRDTYFKREPAQAVELSPSELYRVRAGTNFPLQSYAYGTDLADFNGHIKFTLENREINGFNTWFIYEGHAEVLANGKVVYSQVEHEKPQVVRIIRDTLLKREPVQSVELPPEARVPVEAGTELNILAYGYADDEGDFNNHIKFTLARQEDYINDFNTWFVFENDAQVFYDGELVYPQDSSPPTGVAGNRIGIKLPGFTSTFYLSEPIIPGGKFTWAEATKNGSRIPSTRAVVENILVLAELLERPRRQIGQPFIVTSWYRPPVINRMVGGATYSRHLYGQAVDFYVPGIPARTVASQLTWWPGGLGAYAGWVHLDTGPRRRWYR
jgi:hypothetical protein